jgi:hypothetical protein
MPGNNIYYTSDQNLTKPNIKLKFKQKFEPKLMLYTVISDRGISKPYLRSSKTVINKVVYINDCLKGNFNNKIGSETQSIYNRYVILAYILLHKTIAKHLNWH